MGMASKAQSTQQQYCKHKYTLCLVNIKFLSKRLIRNWVHKSKEKVGTKRQWFTWNNIVLMERKTRRKKVNNIHIFIYGMQDNVYVVFLWCFILT